MIQADTRKAGRQEGKARKGRKAGMQEGRLKDRSERPFLPPAFPSSPPTLHLLPSCASFLPSCRPAFSSEISSRCVRQAPAAAAGPAAGVRDSLTTGPSVVDRRRTRDASGARAWPRGSTCGCVDRLAHRPHPAARHVVRLQTRRRAPRRSTPRTSPRARASARRGCAIRSALVLNRGSSRRSRRSIASQNRSHRAAGSRPRRSAGRLSHAAARTGAIVR